MKELSSYKCYSAFAGDIRRYIGKKRSDIDYEAFIEENQYWLCDYSLFNKIKDSTSSNNLYKNNYIKKKGGQ